MRDILSIMPSDRFIPWAICNLAVTMPKYCVSESNFVRYALLLAVEYVCECWNFCLIFIGIYMWRNWNMSIVSFEGNFSREMHVNVYFLFPLIGCKGKFIKSNTIHSETILVDAKYLVDIHVCLCIFLSFVPCSPDTNIYWNWWIRV